MKAAKELNRLRNAVAAKALQKLALDGVNAEPFIQFLLQEFNKTNSDINQSITFETNLKIAIAEENLTLFSGYFQPLSYENLIQINNIENLGIIIPDTTIYSSTPSSDAQVTSLPSQLDRFVLSDIRPQNIDQILQKLLLAFELPKTFKAFRELDESRKNAFYELGIDATSARKYKPTDCQKKILDVVKKHFATNPDYSVTDLPYLVKNSILGVGVDSTIASDIATKMLDHIADENKKIKGIARITKLAEQNGLAIDDITENPDRGANSSFTAMVNGKKYYIKTCSNDVYLAANGMVDPNEIFIYKVMEYMNFGPKTTFLFGRFSSVAGRSSISRGNFIMTEDVNQHGNELFLDMEDNHAIFQSALQNKEFAIELSAASALNDILSLTDTFGRNGRNYGLLQKADGSHIVQFVDHLPNATNGLFSVSHFDPTTYSPRAALQRKANQLRDDEYSALKDLEPSRSIFDKILINRDVSSRLSNLPEAIARARSDVQNLMDRYEDNFVEAANTRIDSYIVKINKNTETYQSTIVQAGKDLKI